MNLVVFEVADQLFVECDTIIDGGVSKLVQDVVETRSPLSGSGLGSEGAVVNHEGNSSVVHVWAQRVNSFDDGLVDDLGVRVSFLEEDIDLGHHGSNVDTSGEGVERDLVFVTFGTDLFSKGPGVGSVDLSDRVSVDSITVHDNGSDFVSGADLVVNLLKDFLRRLVGGRVGSLEDLLVITTESVVDGLDSLCGDDLDNVSGDGFTGVDEGFFLRHTLSLVSSVEGFDNSVNGSEKNSTFSVDIGAVFRSKRGFEHERGSDGNTPSEGQFGGLSAHILVDGEGGVDSGSVDFLTLFVQTTDGRSHSLGADGDDVHVIGEFLSDGVEVSQKESVGKSKGGAGLHGGEDFLVQFGLGGIGNQQHDQVGVLDNLEHLSEGAIFFAETNGLGLFEGGGSLTESDGDLDVGTGFLQGIGHVLGLGGSLGSPSDNTNILDALESLGKEGEEVTSSLHDGLLRVGEINFRNFENFGRETVEQKITKERKFKSVRQFFRLR